MGCGSSTPVESPSTVDFDRASRKNASMHTDTAALANSKPGTSIAPGEAVAKKTAAGGDANHNVATDANSSSVLSVASRKKPPRKGTAAAAAANSSSIGSSSPMKRRSLTKKKGGANHPTASQPLMTRLRADTWETILTDDLQEPPPADRLLDAMSASPNRSSSYPMDEAETDERMLAALSKDSMISSVHSNTPTNSSRNHRKQHPVPSKLSKLVTDAPGSTMGPVQEQWRTLWETQSAALVDPADVVSVLDQLLCQTVNQLSDVQITLLLRKVRGITSRELPKAADVNHNSASSKIVKVFAGGGASSSNHQHSLENTEARLAMEKYHVLAPSFLLKLLPKSTISSSVTESIITLMMALDTNTTTSILLERVVTAATSAAEAIGLDMDVNRLPNKTFKMPKPSQIPVFLDDPSLAEHWPLGASLPSVAALIAMATAASRPQKLQLLFYICMDPTVLKEFLMAHPAGGIPLWLLEVGHSTVVSLPSLTHYHYFGNAFVPCDGGTVANRRHASSLSFIPSKSRTPVTVDANHVQSMVRQVLERVTQPKPATTMTPEANGDILKMEEKKKLPPQSPRNGASSLIRRGSSFDDAPDVESNANSSTSVEDKKITALMQKLRNVSEGIEFDTFCSSLDTLELNESLQIFDRENTKFLEQFDVSDWTIQEFKQWADQTLDDMALQVVMHHFFAEGILPSPMMERDLVGRKWYEWEQQQLSLHEKDKDGQSITEMLSNSVISLLGSSSNAPTGSATKSWDATQMNSVFGGIGGFDGLGGPGYGVLYCIPTPWWNAWKDYTGWTFAGEPHVHRRKGLSRRPKSLETECLLERDPDKVIRGVMGSCEVMRPGLKQGTDYVLIPPGVWDVLFELYSGGPPLPRMIQPPEKSSFISLIDPDISPRHVNSVDKPGGNSAVGSMDSAMRVKKLSDRVTVNIYPWILQVHLCDPLQPYRRGDTGPVSIRVMASPKQPLWRLLSEIVGRFTFQTYRAFDTDMRGKIRLWKKIETNDSPLPRYGPWNLLCKSRYALLPYIGNGVDVDINYEEMISSWKQYGDNATVESIGLLDQASLMVEFAVQNRNGELTWPREAAAQAGKVRRLAEEDKQFRQVLLGIDDNGKTLANPPNLVGMDVDAMEFSGKWYTVKILEVLIVETVAEEEDDDGFETEICDTPRRVKKKRVKVNFREHGGHMDWIDVDSDRLQTPGRFASEADLQSPETPTNGNGSTHNSNDGRSKSGATAKRSNSTSETVIENTKSCPLPAFGACGLTNLGNTCYLNSAVQCMAYLPLLRAYLLSTQYKATNDINKNNPLGTGGRLLEEFAELLRSVWSARLAEKSPTRFRTHLGKCNDQFSGADQQDAQEFLNYMIDVLHEDSNRVRKKPYVEALEDVWVGQTSLPRVGEESWRRFLRRNQSIMADVAMGQALNTVTCPVCHYSSRNFDPFNLLSIPIPTIADVLFLCTVVRRSTPRNCPWILNKPAKGDGRSNRFPGDVVDKNSQQQPPSALFSCEQYVIALSRLADGGDLRLQIQNLSGIRADQLRLFRSEVILVNSTGDDDSPTKRYVKAVSFPDKEGLVSQLLKTRTSSDESSRLPTQIIAFEVSLNTRLVDKAESKQESLKDTDADDLATDDRYPSPSEIVEIEQYLGVYGDEQECRFVDTDPLVLAKAVSKSLWPRSESELRIGLRVDAKDHRGIWCNGSVVDIFDDEVNGGDADTGQEVAIQQRKVRVLFDDNLPKAVEVFSIEHFKKGRVNPLCSFAEPKLKPTEFIGHHRYTNRSVSQPFLFGQPFFIQCHNEWTNARAGAHILAQASRFLGQRSYAADVMRLFDKVHCAISELIDFLVEIDREFILRALGASSQSTDERIRPFRNPSFDSATFISESNKKISALLNRLPFEMRLCPMEPTNSISPDEIPFPLTLNKTIGNFVRSHRSAIVLHWREPSVEKKSGPVKCSVPSILYVDPMVHVHESSAAVLRSDTANGPKKMDQSGEIDLAYCLTEFCKVQKLPMSDNWVCPRCKVIREGGQNMNLWRIPDLLTFHIKRFNMSARWHEKITTKVNFPMTGLDMSEWCHKESPVLHDGTKDSCIYDLIGVMNHYGSLTGGHYVATCKATLCGRDGNEEVAYSFNGVGSRGTRMGIPESLEEPSGSWVGLGRPKPSKVSQSRVDAALSSVAVAESVEPTWLQFDDEMVEVIPPRQVVSEMAYVLFYRKRHLTSSNIAKYSTFE